MVVHSLVRVVTLWGSPRVFNTSPFCISDLAAMI